MHPLSMKFCTLLEPALESFYSLTLQSFFRDACISLFTELHNTTYVNIVEQKISCLHVSKLILPAVFQKRNQSFAFVLEHLQLGFELLSLQSRKKIMGQGKEIKYSWTESTNFDICFCVVFGCYDQNLFSAKETGHQAKPSIKLNFFKYILASKVVQQLVRQLVHQVCCTRNEVPLYLWRIKSILKCCIVSLHYFRDCTLPSKILSHSF